jgi:hypothetical protein
VVAGTASGWIAMWLGLLLGRDYRDEVSACAFVGWPCEVFLSEVPREPALLTNYAWTLWPDSNHRAHVLDSDDCLANFLLFGVTTAVALLPLRGAGSERLMRLLRWGAPAVALGVLAVRRLSHDRW